MSLEILSPAGDLERLKAAVDFGADAVYLAGKQYGMRTAAGNFDIINLKKGIDYAHKNNVKVYVTLNTIPHNNELVNLPKFLEVLNDLKADAAIVSDVGVIKNVKKYAPNLNLHISVQSGIVNYESANFYHELGAQRVVLARELSLEEISEIRAKTSKDLELEAFVHGAMCVSFSARCLLSSYMTGRDANRGDCAQPCRWSYALVEEKRPGQYFPVTETKEGTYILNANDLCMAEHLNKIKQAGVNSIKIEGRAKSHYYVAAITNTYYLAVNSLNNAKNLDAWQLEENIKKELLKISHRGYSTGFYFGKPENSQTYENAGYVRDYSVAAIVKDYKDGMIIAEMKNKFSKGITLDCLEPKKLPFEFVVENLYDENDNEIESAIHPTMLVKIPFKNPVKKGSLLRMKS